MFGIRKHNENYRCETDVIYFRQQEMGQNEFETANPAALSGNYSAYESD